MNNRGLDAIATTKLPKLSSLQITEFVFKNIFLLFLVAFVLFFLSMGVSSGLSHLFKSANETIEYKERNGIIEKYSNEWNASWIFLTFIHLFIIAMLYYFIDQYFLHNIDIPKTIRVRELNTKVGRGVNNNYKSVSATQQETFGTAVTTEYVFHIILIIVLIEMDSSLVHELHEVANILAHDRDYRNKKDEAISFLKKNKEKLENMLDNSKI